MTGRNYYNLVRDELSPQPGNFNCGLDQRLGDGLWMIVMDPATFLLSCFYEVQTLIRPTGNVWLGLVFGLVWFGLDIILLFGLLLFGQFGLDSLVFLLVWYGLLEFVGTVGTIVIVNLKEEHKYIRKTRKLATF